MRGMPEGADMQIKSDQTARDLIGVSQPMLDPETVERSAEWVMLLDDAGRVHTASEGSHAALYDHSHTTFVGKLWASFWPDGTQDVLHEAVSRGFQGRITQYLGHREHDAGEVSHWHIRVSPVEDDAGRVVSVMAVSQNLAAQ